MAKKLWFCGKNILLTGASSGIGFYLAKILTSKYSCSVIGIGRNVSKLEKAKEEIDKEIEFVSNNKKIKGIS